jgi:hypothetical protein
VGRGDLLVAGQRRKRIGLVALPGKYLLISSSRIATPIRISLWTTTTSPRQRESAALSRPPVLDQIKFVQVATSPQQVCNSRNIHRPCGVF